MSWFIKIIQTIFFCVFFAVGLAAITITALSNEIADYYYNKAYLAQTQIQIEQIKELYNSYDEQISLIKQQPQVLERLNTIQLGELPPDDEQTFYPSLATDVSLEAIQASKIANADKKSAFSQSPAWLASMEDQNRRYGFYGLGSVLILLSFTCFNKNSETSDSK